MGSLPYFKSSLNRGLFAFMPYELRTLDSDVLDWISSRCLNVGLFFLEVHMLRIIKQIFCIHVWEYELDYSEDRIKECRKCGKIKCLQPPYRGS